MNKKILYLYNLCEIPNVSSRSIQRLVDFCDEKNDVDIEVIYESLGNTPTASKIVTEFSNLDYNFLSVYALLYIGINLAIVEKLRENFSSIENMSENIFMINNMNLQKRTREKIHDFIKSYNMNKDSELSSVATEIITQIKKTNSAMTANELFLKVHSSQSSVTSTSFYVVLNEMMSKNLIDFSASSVSLAKQSIDSFFKNEHKQENRNISIVLKRLKGDSVESLSKECLISRQRIAQIIQDTISDFPIFSEEDKYHEILSKYKLTKNFLEKINFGNALLSQYIEIKYGFSERKSELDYIMDMNLVHQQFAVEQLRLNNLYVLNSEIYKFNFLDFVRRAADMKKATSFGVAEIIEDVNMMIKEIGFASECVYDLKVFARRLENSTSFLSFGNNNYLVYDEELYDDKFRNIIYSYLDDFYGYGYVTSLFLENISLFKEYNINCDLQLFSVMKQLVSDKYSKRIRFVRNPSIATEEITVHQFILESIEELQPIHENEFYEYLKLVYGYNDDRISQWSTKSWFLKLRSSDGTLTMSNKQDLSDFSEVVSNIVKERFIVSRDYFEHQLETNDSYISKNMLTKHSMLALGFRLTNTAVFSDHYRNYYDAYIEQLKFEPPLIDKNHISILLNEDDINNPRYNKVFRGCHILKIKNENYLNVAHRICPSTIVLFRDNLIQSLPVDVITTIEEIKNKQIYSEVTPNFRDIQNLVHIFGDVILFSIMESSQDITTIVNNGIMTLCKGKRVSIRAIITDIVGKKISIFRTELEDLLDKKYGVRIDLNKSFLTSLGLHFDEYRDKVYDSIERANREVTQFLEEEKSI